MAETKRNGTEIKAVLSTNKGSVPTGQSLYLLTTEALFGR
ncbi:hypothetical protein M128_2784 [Bacteroides fragilis str. S6L8]|uniref:Uncharacterized protein n=2 Tax=Bacteroides fragilis TaxID=817 RepID=A0A015YZX6_BACFG|nr:hypothetical protein M124_2188 [Bacteroides fragilis str. 3988T(B)14]EXZ28194.1 hypothetical protein M136_2622 [Bacteroides fragilis str. S36L11]EXZ88783.1 hypothetical protein M068_2616 [Bacteroides fragilis str. J38-1]EYA04335.1 hypothetical protein M126_2929 [Bacteroides fragilis str. S6L3]EYA08868.1 hypothetical protein M130_2731 [Bacteroides fragilis str. S6R6]EYA65935.1 hypothetical protein M139_2650 [Bacteroides fragilis str. S23L24]EYA84904.1 hypothetical protein M137_3340 [Bactero